MSDLISRSALIEYLEKVTVTEGITFETGFKQILTDIKNQPTVEAKPVVYGKWNIGSKPRCSVCGKSALREYDRDDWLSYVPSNYCPHCGADMRGVKND